MKPDEFNGFGQDAFNLVKTLPTTAGARSLAVVMFLPVVSGIFPSIVLAGGVTTVVSAIELGLLVFSGGASVAIVLVEFDSNRRDNLLVVTAIGVVLIPSAAVTAALSPTVQLLLWIELFTGLTAIVVCAIGVSIGYDADPRWIPSPAKLGMGLCTVALSDALFTVLVEQPSLTVVVDHRIVWLSAIAAGTGVIFVGLLVFARPILSQRLNFDRLRIGCSIALCLVGTDIAGFARESPAIVAIGCTAILAYNAPKQSGGVLDQSDGTQGQTEKQRGDRI